MVEEDCLKKRLSKGKCFFRGGQPSALFPRSIPCDDALYKTSMEPLDTVEFFRCPVQGEWWLHAVLYPRARVFRLS